MYWSFEAHFGFFLPKTVITVLLWKLKRNVWEGKPGLPKATSRQRGRVVVETFFHVHCCPVACPWRRGSWLSKQDSRPTSDQVDKVHPKSGELCKVLPKDNKTSTSSRTCWIQYNNSTLLLPRKFQNETWKWHCSRMDADCEISLLKQSYCTMGLLCLCYYSSLTSNVFVDANLIYVISI